MNIKQLKYFVGVLKDRSITKAASRLFVAQPALGLQIRKLEEELNVELFVRHSRGVDPTEAGVRLAAHAEALIRQFERARQDMLEYGGEPQGRVTVGLTSGTCSLLASKLIARCQQEYPNINLCLSDALSEQLMEWVADDRIDMTLTYNPDSTPGLITEPLACEVLHFVQNKNNRDLSKADATLANILNTDLVLPSSPHLVREVVDDAARNLGLEVKLSSEVNSVHAIKELIRQQMVTSIMPMATVLREVQNGEFEAWPVKAPVLERTLYIAHSANQPCSKAFAGVVNLLRNSVRELAKNGEAGWTLYPSRAKLKLVEASA